MGATLQVSLGRGLFSALRPRQWLKNVLVAAAPAAAGEITSHHVFLRVTALFFLLCAVSGAGYLLNDVRDVAYDRAHPEKRFRAVASGRVSEAYALRLAGALAGAAVLTGTLFFGVVVGALLVAYLITTVSYTLWLKTIPGIEMVVLSAGFLLRAIIGGAGTKTELSSWFLVVICASALTVVAGKRLSELARVTSATAGGTRRSALGAYSHRYLTSVTLMCASVAVAGYVAWLLFVGIQRHQPLLVGFSALPFAVAFARYLKLISRGSVEAPEDALLGDITMIACGVLWLGSFSVAVMWSA